jgi:hypothetical protein
MASSLNTQFEVPAKMKTWSLVLIVVGIIAFIIGLFTKGMSSDLYEKQVFWGTIMYNAIFFLLITNIAMFFICVHTLAMSGWQVTMQRIPEAIAATVPVFGTIAGVVLIGIVMSKLHIYQWTNWDAVKNDAVSLRARGFLNLPFFILWTVATIGLWIFLGARMRKLSAEADEENMGLQKGQNFIWRNTVTAGMFIAWFGLTAGCVTPWFWQMSLDIHWASTLYSWYTFASSFVGGLALITLFFIFLKKQDYMELSNREHLHDLGKYLFAFSIFWTYLWFSQYMLIWYANIPEETVYFKQRVQGEYKAIFFLTFIINFICPILILMSRPSKRNYTWLIFMSALLLAGHWLDFYQMIMGSISPMKLTLSWLDGGILALFVGLLIFCVGRALTKRPLVPKYHPFLKESIIHHT